MDAGTFDTFLNQIVQLSRHQCAQLLAALTAAIDKARACATNRRGSGWRRAIDQERIRSPETLFNAAIGVFHR